MAEKTEWPALGLAYGTVAVVPHHQSWSDAFAAEHQRLRDGLVPATCPIEHIGSTAVPGLRAKPILDIGILLPHRDDLKAVASHAQLKGYMYRGDKGQNGGHVFVFDVAPKVRSIHLHAIADGDPQWAAYLRFRDALRADARLRQDYAALKDNLQKTFATDRAGYTAGKTAFIRDVLSAV